MKKKGLYYYLAKIEGSKFAQKFGKSKTQKKIVNFMERHPKLMMYAGAASGAAAGFTLSVAAGQPWMAGYLTGMGGISGAAAGESYSKSIPKFKKNIRHSMKKQNIKVPKYMEY